MEAWKILLAAGALGLILGGLFFLRITEGDDR